LSRKEIQPAHATSSSADVDPWSFSDEDESYNPDDIAAVSWNLRFGCFIDIAYYYYGNLDKVPIGLTLKVVCVIFGKISVHNKA
jgi:hypothetical protein